MIGMGRGRVGNSPHDHRVVCLTCISAAPQEWCGGWGCDASSKTVGPKKLRNGGSGGQSSPLAPP
jgi:hypothetical protein